MFRNILVAVDRSPDSEQALREAIRLVQAGHGRLTLLASIPRPPSWATSPAAVAACQPLACELEHEAEQLIRRARDRVPQGVPLTTVLTRQPLRAAVLAQVERAHHDLVVIGSRCQTTWGALRTRTSRYLQGHSPVPVLVVSEQDEERGGLLDPFRGGPRSAHGHREDLIDGTQVVVA